MSAKVSCVMYSVISLVRAISYHETVTDPVSYLWQSVWPWLL